MEAEPYYLDDNGKRQDDWIHEEILDNPAADAAFEADVVAKEMSETGRTEAEVRARYGLKPAH